MEDPYGENEEIFRSVHKAGVDPQEAEQRMLGLVERMEKWNSIKEESK